MRSDSVLVRALTSQVILRDELDNRFPGALRRPITVAGHGLVVATLMEQDGPTEVRVHQVNAPPLDAPPAGTTTVFDGELIAPSRVLVLVDVLGEVLGRYPTTTARCRVRVAIDHPSEPSLIDIVLWPAPHGNGPQTLDEHSATRLGTTKWKAYRLATSWQRILTVVGALLVFLSLAIIGILALRP